MNSTEDIQELMTVIRYVAEGIDLKIQEAKKTDGSFDENDQAASMLVSMIPDLQDSLEYTQDALKSWSQYKEKLERFIYKQLKKAPAAPKHDPPYPDVELILPLVLKMPIVVYKPTNPEVADDDIEPVLYFTDDMHQYYAESNLFDIENAMTMLTRRHNVLNTSFPQHCQLISFREENFYEPLVMKLLDAFNGLTKKIISARASMVEIIFQALLEFQRKCDNRQDLINTHTYNKFQDVCDKFFTDRNQFEDFDSFKTCQEAYQYYSTVKATFTLLQWPPFHPVRKLFICLHRHLLDLSDIYQQQHRMLLFVGIFLHAGLKIYCDSRT
jgi:hypothetical protein